MEKLMKSLIAVSFCLSLAVSAVAQPPAMTQLGVQFGAPAAFPAPAVQGTPVVVPPGGFEQQNRAWDELVRPLESWAKTMDWLDKDANAQASAILAAENPGSTLWGKDIAGRVSMKTRIGALSVNLQQELRLRQNAYAIAWRLYQGGEIARLDAQGQALAAKHLQRLVAPEKDLTQVNQRLQSMRSGKGDLLSRGMDSSIVSGLDSWARSDYEIRRYAHATRQLIGAEAKPQPQP
jgi:hypothetical protein